MTLPLGQVCVCTVGAALVTGTAAEAAEAGDAMKKNAPVCKAVAAKSIRLVTVESPIPSGWV